MNFQRTLKNIPVKLTVFIVLSVSLVVIGHLDVLIIDLVFGFPRHLVLFLQSPPRVGEPSANLKAREIRVNDNQFRG